MVMLQAMTLMLLAAVGAAVVVTRDPVHQAIVVSLYGLVLAVLFLLLDAPGVALSEVVVGAVAVPLMILLAMAKVRDYARRHQGAEDVAEESAREGE